MSKTAQNFGVNLTRICEQRGLSHRKVAERGHITEIRMSRYVQGKKEPTWVDVHNLATALGCEPEYLMQEA